MRRLFALAFAVVLGACAASTENVDDNAQPVAGACPHDFILQRADGMLTDVGVVQVYWGTWWQSAPGSDVRANQDATWRLLANDARFYRALQAYAPAAAIHGRFLASATIGTEKPTPATVSKDEFEAELASAIASGTLPQKTNDTVPIHVVYLPEGTTGPELDGPNGPIDYAAYHHWMTLPSGEQVPYVVVLYDGGVLDVAESHELFETIANPFSRGWRDRYKDSTGQYPEVADVCEGDFTKLDARLVQKLWSPGACACVAPSVTP